MEFPNYLKTLREERGLTLRELSKLCDPAVDHAYIYRLETGQKTDPSKAVIKTLAKALRLRGKRRELFFRLARHWEIDDLIVEAFLREDSDLVIKDVDLAVSLRSRGAHPKTADEWIAKLHHIRDLL